MSEQRRQFPQALLWGLVVLAVLGAALVLALSSGWFAQRNSPAPTEPLTPSEPVDTRPSLPPPVDATQTSATTAKPIPAGIGTRIGERAPDFSLPSLSGQTMSLSQFRGHIVILDFWASWCGPCRSTMPAVHALWRAVTSRGVDLVGISLDRTASAASSYLATNGFDDMVAVWGSLASAGAVASLYGVSGIPRTIVIDRNGIVRFNNHSAMLDRAVLDSIP